MKDIYQIYNKDQIEFDKIFDEKNMSCYSI